MSFSHTTPIDTCCSHCSMQCTCGRLHWELWAACNPRDGLRGGWVHLRGRNPCLFLLAVNKSAHFFTQVVPTVANPVSVAFGDNHLYILDAKKVESHLIVATLVVPIPMASRCFWWQTDRLPRSVSSDKTSSSSPKSPT